MSADDRVQPGLPGVGVPREAIEYLTAVRRLQGETDRDLTNADIAAELHMHPRTWDYRKRDLRGRRWGRDFIEVWPPPRDWHPTWEAEIARHLPTTPDGAAGLRVVREPGVDDHMQPVLIEELFDEHGVSLSRRLIDRFPALVAGFIGYTLLDLMSDGRLDGIIRFARSCLHGRVT